MAPEPGRWFVTVHDAGTITERFPTPVEITLSFLTEAYTQIGLAAGHIEQLTGQRADRLLQLLAELRRHPLLSVGTGVVGSMLSKTSHFPSLDWRGHCWCAHHL